MLIRPTATNSSSFHYTRRVGVSTSVERARRGELDDVAATVEVKWVTDGERTAKVIDAHDVQMVESEEDSVLTNDWEKFAYLPMDMSYFHCKHVELIYSRSMNDAMLRADARATPSYSSSPFDLNVMGYGEEQSPSAIIRQNLISGAELRLERPDAHAPEQVKMVYDRGSGCQISCVLDGSKGHCIKRATLHGPTPGNFRHVEVLRTMQCKNGGWIPEHAIRYRVEKSRVLVEEWVVTKVTCGLPTATDLGIEIPEGASLNLMTEKIKSRTLARTTWVDERSAMKLLGIDPSQSKRLDRAWRGSR